jgi:O-antigen biosynthesis rhamnosyltransferase
LRVLHFYKTYFPESFGGVEQFIYQLALGGSRRGIDTQVLSLTKRPTALQTTVCENHRSHHVRQSFEVASTGISFGAFKRFKALASTVDIIHYHYPWPFADVVHFATPISKPTVLTYHSDIVRQRNLLSLYKPLMKRFLGSVDRIVATSPNYLETSNTLKDYRNKIEVIPIGLDRSSYPDPDAALHEKWRSEVGEGFFLFVGVLRYYKGLHILLDAIRGTDYRVVIVGAGPIEFELRQHAAEIGLNQVHFLGALSNPDKATLFDLSLAVVFPSNLRSEAFGITLLEGAMYGKPLISSEIGTGTSYVNVDQQTGLVVSPDDPVALRDAMRQLYENPKMAKEKGRQAYLRYLEYFTADRMVDRYARLYEELILSHKTK